MSKHTGIRKLPNGRFRARYFAGYTSEGKRVYPARTFDTQREALEWLAEEKTGRGPGAADSRKLTLAVYLDQWLKTKHAIRDNTRDAYQFSINAYIKPGLGRVRLNRLSPKQIEDWQAELLTRFSKSTVASARSVLFGACKKAVKMQMLRSNPVAGTDGAGRGKSKRYHMTVDEALRLGAACEGQRFGLLFQLALATGLRPEELIGLTWADLELTNARGVLRVSRVVHHHRKGGGWSWQEPKTKNSNRILVFPAELASRLNDHRKSQLEAKLKVGRCWQGNDLVFPTNIGTPVRQAALHKYFKKILASDGLSKEITPYSMRHFFVTFSLMAGVDPKTVSSEAGHADVAFTLTRYGSVLDEMHEAASEKRAALFKSKAK